MYEVFEQLLKKHGVTPYRVHKETGVPQSTLSDWKNGKGVPKVDKLKAIADYFGVTVDYLLGNEQKEKPLVNNDEELTAYLEELKTRPEMKMLFNLAKGATKEDVEKAVKIVEAFLKKD
jgi:transcriptional regulator with XRE-family HTH domain